MKAFLAVLYVVVLSIEVATCALVCTGNPPQLNGKPCATTTLNDTDFVGHCGCGDMLLMTRFDWFRHGYTVGASSAVFGTASKTCGSGCGQCVRLTTTGGYVDGAGSKHIAGENHVFMITDRCSDPSLCVNTPNAYGYEAHFELNDQYLQMSSDLRWDNPEVTWEFIDCDDEIVDVHTPSGSWFEECECYVP